MSSERQREIARKGGRAAHECGKAHEFTTDEARAAGRKGGEAVSANRTHMSEIGRLGGRRSAGRRATGVKPDAGKSTGQGTAVIDSVEPSGQTDGHAHVNQEHVPDSHARSQPQPT